MHLELRISCIDGICAFDAESFIRMHQLRYRPLHEASLRQALVTFPAKCRAASNDFRPHLKLQFVFENLVCIESSEIIGEVESQQHEKQVKTNWDASEIRTKRYRCYLGEAIIASLPLFVAERHVKIRLVQLAPVFSTQDTALVRSFCPFYFEMQDKSLCIGVAKMSLRELLVTNGGISVMLQAKQNMISAVEALNLNPAATNAMFGKDIGASAVLTFQAVSIVFNNKSFSSLLCCSLPKNDATSTPSHLGSSDKNGVVSLGGSTGTTGMDVERVLELREQLGSSAVRFVLVPYIVLIDTVIRLNEAVSWRHPPRTLLFLAIICVVLLADVVEMGLMLGFMAEVVTTLRMGILFCRALQTPMNLSRDFTVSLSGRRDSFQPVLYGCHSRIINSMVRARLFFCQGLQADCYLELAFLFHRFRRVKRWLLPWLTLLLLSFSILSMETLTVLFLLTAFVAHPVMLRVSFYRFRKIWSRQLTPENLRKAIKLCHPMRVSLLVHVSEPQEKLREKHNLLSLVAPCSTSPARSFVNCLPPLLCPAVTEDFKHHRIFSSNFSTERLGGPCRSLEELAPVSGPETQGTRLFSTLGAADSTAAVAANMGSLQLHPLSSKITVRTCSDGVMHDAQQRPLLTFAVIVLTSEALSVNGNSVVAQRLRRILQRARALNRPPPASLLRDQYQTYFNSVLCFLQFLRRQCTLDTYMTLLPPSTSSSCLSRPEGGTVKLDHLANLAWLIEKGEDDGITSTLLAHSSHQVVLGKLQPLQYIDNTARAFALLALYLLQGSRLSLYNGAGNRGCSVIIPLKMGSNDIEAVSEPNPCPSSLRKALTGFWKGLTGGDPPINVSTDVVLKVIATYKVSWGHEGAAPAAGLDLTHRFSASLNESEVAFDVSKRSLQPFNAASSTCKRQRVSSYSTAAPQMPSFPLVVSPSDMDRSMSFVRRPFKSLGASDAPSVGRPENFHRSTQSWTHVPSKFHRPSQHVVSVPRNFVQKLPSGGDGSSSGVPRAGNTRAGSDELQQSENSDGSP